MRSPPDPAKLAINGVTLREQWNQRELIEGLARRNIHGISVWRDKMAALGVKETAKLLRDHGMVVTGVCRGGAFPAADRNGRRAAIDDSRRAIDEAAAIEARCLVVIGGGLPAGSKDLRGAHEMVRDGLGEILDHAREAGVPLALEPLHPMVAADRGCVNTLAHALDLCDQLDSSQSGAIGVAVDCYHVWWDPELERNITRAGEKRLLAFHICDWLVPTTDLVFDRGMMGDGVIDIALIRSWMEAAGYRGMHEVEIMSRRWWQRDPHELLSVCRERHETVC